MSDETLHLNIAAPAGSDHSSIPSKDSGARRRRFSLSSLGRESEHPESRHLNRNTQEMHPMGFGMRNELFCPAAVAAAIDQPNGLQATKERITRSFMAQWGVEQAHWQRDLEASLQTLKRMDEEHSRLTDVLRSVPTTTTTTDTTLPRGTARWGWIGLFLALLVLSALAITNAASYFKFQTQGWFTALLMAAPLLFVSIPVKFACSKVTEPARRRIGWLLAVLGTTSFAVFVYTLAMRANPPSMAAILDGTARPLGNLISLQLASQIVLEIVVSAALWWWMIALIVSPAKAISNPEATLLSGRLAALEAEMIPVRKRAAEAEGNLQEFAGCLQYWLHLAETMFVAHQAQEERAAKRLAALSSWPHFGSIDP